MKKYLPLILLGAGLLVVVAGIFVVKSFKKQTGQEEIEATVPEIPQDQRPIVSLTPTDDGHWLNFRVQKIKVQGAASMDYELVYSTQNGGQQGVPGTVKLDGNDVERKLLLGSESSGKFRYDVGVETGTMTLRFRNSSGKLIGKLSTQFHLQTGEKLLHSADDKFQYELDKAPKGVYFVTMATFVQPDSSMTVFSQNGYSIFASDGLPHSGKSL